MKQKAPIEVKPGKLMTGLSADSAGIANYIVKREWRRILDRDVRAEGYEWFRPNTTYDKLLQSIPPNSTDPITLISGVTIGNGRLAIIAGNKTTLWRYWGLEAANYCDDPAYPGQTYWDTEGGSTYTDDGLAGWKVIGSGFSPNGNRWEAVGVGEWLVLNNGVDLPMTYNLQELSVKPIYELREQQVACVGTIAMQDGILCCGDISQISDSAFQAIMAPIPAAVAASCDNNGRVSPNAATLFPNIPAAQLVGLTLFWGTGEVRGIQSIDANGFIIVDNTLTVASGSVSVENAAAYARFTDQNNISRYRWRFFPSMPSLPRRFGASFPVNFSAGSRWGTLNYPVRSIPELISTQTQTSFVFNGIALGSGNLTANIVWTYPGITNTVLIDKTPVVSSAGSLTTASDGSTLMEAADAAASFAGIFEDLEDDGGGIIKMLTLQGQLVIYKDTPVIFVASYTGDLTTPFQFQKIPIAAEAAALKYRNCIIAGGGGYYGSYHLYAGTNGFYKFDSFMQTPTEIPVLQSCSDLFFAQAAADPENCFCVENPMTREIYFVFPNAEGLADNAICYDYAYQTARTTSVPLTAAARVQHPVTRDYQFVMGLSDGSLKRYGLIKAPVVSSLTVTASLNGGVATAGASFFTPAHVGQSIVFANGVIAAIDGYVDAKHVIVFSATATSPAQPFTIIPAIYHRDGAAYDSVLESGLDAFGFTHGEKMLNEYVLSLSSKSPNTTLTVVFKGAVNPAESQDLQTATIVSPDFQNLVKPTLLQYYIGTRITASGMNNPVEYVGQLLNIQPVASHSFGRRPT